MKKWIDRAKQLKRQVMVLYYAYRDARTPMWAKVAAFCVVAYALSPIDLIPDFIPILGYLDDVVLVPLGILLTLKLIPPEVLIDSQELAESRQGQDRKANWIVAAFIIALWVAAGISLSYALYRYWL